MLWQYGNGIMIWNQGGKARAFPSFFVRISLELWGIRSAAQHPELLKNVDIC